MCAAHQTSDRDIVELLRQSGSLGIAELTRATEVTPTAVRQRLARLMEQGDIERHTLRSGRGRPTHRYVLTEKGHRQGGSNFGDLALMLWEEIRSIDEPSVRRGLISRMAKRMAGLYADRVTGDTEARMQAVAEVFGDRDVPVAVEKAVHGTSSLPVIDGPEKKKTPDGVATLTVWACPYPELAEVDRGICAMERMMFAELLEQNVRLTACRLDGDACCQFQTGPLPVSNAVASS